MIPAGKVAQALLEGMEQQRHSVSPFGGNGLGRNQADIESEMQREMAKLAEMREKLEAMAAPAIDEQNETSAKDFIRPDAAPATTTPPPGNAPSWVRDGGWWGSAHNILGSLGIAKEEQDDIIHRCFGVASMDEYRGKESQAQSLKKLREFATHEAAGERKPTQAKDPANAPLASAKIEPQNGQKAVEVPATPTVENAPKIVPQNPSNLGSDTTASKPADIPTVTGVIMDDVPPEPSAEPSREIALFDPKQAIARVKGTAALINKMYVDEVLVSGVDYGPVPGTDKPTLLKPGAEKLLSAFSLFDKFIPVEIVRDWRAGFFVYEYECTLYDRESGKAIGSGIGSCNSMEKKYRYRWVTQDRVPRGIAIDTLPVKGGRISEPEFAIEGSATTGKYGKPLEYWQQFKNAIAAGTAVAIDSKTGQGKPMKRWEIDTTMYGIPNEDVFDLVNTICKMAQKRALVAATLNATGASAVFGQDLEDLADWGIFSS